MSEQEKLREYERRKAEIDKQELDWVEYIEALRQIVAELKL